MFRVVLKALGYPMTAVGIALLLLGCGGGDVHHHYGGHDHGQRGVHVDGWSHHGHRHDGHVGHHTHDHGEGWHDAHRGGGHWHDDYDTVGHRHHDPDLVLRSVRHAAHDGFYRIVFDISRDRALADQAPRAWVSHHGNGTLDVHIPAVTRDVTGHERFRPVTVDRAPVVSFARHQHHRAGVAYRVQLTRNVRYRLFALKSPTRIVLDVE